MILQQACTIAITMSLYVLNCISFLFLLLYIINYVKANGGKGKNQLKIIKIIIFISQIKMKAMVARKYGWRIGGRKFKRDFRTSMILFDAIVKWLMLYRAEVWGYEKHTISVTDRCRSNTWSVCCGREAHIIMWLYKKQKRMGRE